MKTKMRAKFVGGAGEVTGSCTLLDYDDGANRHRVLVDCGARQNGNSVAKPNWGFEAKGITQVILTHAHMDHCGMLPRLYKEGYAGKVFCSGATADLAKLILLDMAANDSRFFEEQDVRRIQWVAVDDSGEGRSSESPFPIGKNLFCYFLRSSHMLGAMSVGIQWLSDLSPEAKDDPANRNTIVFSGDVGRIFEGEGSSFLKPMMLPYSGADEKYLVLESTYGNRLHPAGGGYDEKIARLKRVVKDALDLGEGRRGKLVIPAFALERTQTLLADLYRVLREEPIFGSYGSVDLAACLARGEVSESLAAACTAPAALAEEGAASKPWSALKKAGFNDRIAVYNVSPLSRKANEVYARRLRERRMKNGRVKFQALNDETPTLEDRGDEGLERFLSIYGDTIVDFRTEGARSYENIFTVFNDPKYYERKKGAKKPYLQRIADDPLRPFIAIGASGMCDQGGILECLAEWLGDPTATVLMTGFTPEGTNGSLLKKLAANELSEDELYNRRLELGETSLRLGDVKCRIVDMSPHYSGHADREQLIRFAFDNPKVKRPRPIQVFLNHGIPEGARELATSVDERNRALAEASGLPCPAAILPTQADADRWYDLTEGRWEAGSLAEALEAEGPRVSYDYARRILSFPAGTSLEYVERLHAIFKDAEPSAQRPRESEGGN